MAKKKIVVLTGAGMSAESGLKTFRDANGLWEGHDVMQVASPEGFANNPELVLEFYNQRRRQLLEVAPNKGHHDLAAMETDFDVHIITQNVDNLHEQAGSSKVLHLHGELLKVRSTKNEKDIRYWEKDLIVGDVDQNGHQLRPHIVWFGEMVPQLDNAIAITKKAEVLLIIGTSMQVYPAASLVHYVRMGTLIYFIDPKPKVGASDFPNLQIISKTASEGVSEVIRMLQKT